MKLISFLGCAALLALPAAASAETLTCDAANAIIWKSSKALLSNELSLNGLSAKIDIATVKNDVDQIPEILSEIKSRCQTIIDSATEAKVAVEAIENLPSHCDVEQAQIDKIRAGMDREIENCTAAIAEVDKD